MDVQLMTGVHSPSSIRAKLIDRSGLGLYVFSSLLLPPRLLGIAFFPLHVSPIRFPMSEIFELATLAMGIAGLGCQILR